MRKSVPIALVLVWAILSTWVMPAQAISSYQVTNVPTYNPEPNKALGVIQVEGNPAAVFNGDYFDLNLPNNIDIISHAVTDVNHSFDSISSAVYDHKITVTFGNKAASTDDYLIIISITVDLTNADTEDVRANVIALSNSSFTNALNLVVCKVNQPSNVVSTVPPEEIAINKYMRQTITGFEQTGQYSNDAISSLVVDLTNVLTTGSVSMSVYENGSIAPTNFDKFTTKQTYTWKYAFTQISKYAFGNISNLYRQQYKTYMSSRAYDENNNQPKDVVSIYVYGQYKAQAIAEIFAGIPNCFEIQYYDYYSGGGSSSGSTPLTTPTKPIQAPVADSIKAGNSTNGNVSDVIKTVFQINNNTFVYQGNVIDMDVVPYVKNDRSYVPVRYLAYALGITSDGIAWNQAEQKVTITGNNHVAEMTIGSDTMIIDGTEKKMDVAPEIVENRTMLPARWLAEALGAKVTWDTTTNSVQIDKPGN